ncbi:sensor histidine kinase [Gorillibacterium sp. sgz5001074]|uniref:sensor histidine kinase n=1 Tax=Gorillibacterium sp. sgz5001074 TaxID=3446695 RepID=UPI003F67A4CD
MNHYIARTPIQTKLLIYFLPLLVLSVTMTGVFSYLTAERQLRKNAYYLLSDTVQQTKTYLNDKFYTLFEQLVVIEENNAFRNILSGRGQTVEENRYDDIIDLRKRFDEIYLAHYQMVDSIFVAFNNGRSFHLQKDYIPRKVGVDLADWVDRYQSNERGYYWLNGHQDRVIDTVESRDVLSVFKIIGTPRSEVNGLVLLNMRQQYFLDIMRNVKVSPNGHLALVSPDGVLLSKEPDEKYRVGGDVLQGLTQRSGPSGELAVRSGTGESMTVMYNTIPINGWVIAAVVPDKDILKDAGRIKSFTLVFIVVILLVFAVVATVVARSLSNPIRYLSRQVKQFERGHFDVDFRLEERNEIGVLANGLARLLQSVKELLQKVRDEQERKRQIELLALQSQIQPHFLYNTLASIKHLVDMGENERASSMVGALTRYFRIGISRGKEVIPIREELEHVKSYLTILKLRYSRDFDYEVEVDESVLELPIMKLTLQPIVENAIYHGIKNKTDRGLVRIEGRRRGAEVHLTVTDDGPGIPADKLEQLLASIATPDVEEAPITFGLRNAHMRLRLHFGEGYGLKLESEEGICTRVTVVIPAGGEGDV